MLGFSHPDTCDDGVQQAVPVDFVLFYHFSMSFSNSRPPKGAILLPWKQQNLGPVLLSEMEFSLGKLYCLALISMCMCNFCLKGYHFNNSVPHQQINRGYGFLFHFCLQHINVYA